MDNLTAEQTANIMSRSRTDALIDWNAGDARDWPATVVTADDVEEVLRTQAANDDPETAIPISDRQYDRDATLIADWLADERAEPVAIRFALSTDDTARAWTVIIIETVPADEAATALADYVSNQEAGDYTLAEDGQSATDAEGRTLVALLPDVILTNLTYQL